MSNAVAKKEVKPIDQVKHTLDLMSDRLANVLPDNVGLDRFKAVTITAIASNPSLLNADRTSLLLSCQKAAQDGLLPDGREAAFVMFKNTVQYLPMVGGIVKKLYEHAGVTWLSAQVVYEGDAFAFRLGDNEGIEHEPTLGDRGNIIATYAIAKRNNGETFREVLSIADVEKVRATSRAKDSGPWISFFSEMAKKTAIKRLAKRLPISPELDRLLRRDDEIGEDAPSNDHLPVRNERPKLTRLDAIVANNSPTESGIEPEPQESIEQFNISGEE
jgi:recombination protein RecT